MKTYHGLILSAAMTLSFAQGCASDTTDTTQTAPPAAAGFPELRAGAGIATVETNSGTVQGFEREGIETFRGIPYAQAERFMPPRPTEAWQEKRYTLSYGFVCPQSHPPVIPEPQAFLSDWQFGLQSEDCLNLNVWTPSSNDGIKRPVMVWLHGGGFFSGSSMELPVYDGTNLAGSGDVVVVSINHRLNVLGYLDLSAYGDEYRYSGNAGILDIVAALKWVEVNIGNFGGDAGNVTIFGQSGGGAKVATLMSSPKAQGLFDKAIIQSGAPGSMPQRASEQDVAKRIAALTLEAAGLEAGDIEGLQALEYDQLVAASNAALAKTAGELGLPPGMFGPGLSWAPVVDGGFLPTAPFESEAPSYSREVPLLIGSTLTEFGNINPRLAGKAGWSDADVDQYMQETYGDAADAVGTALEEAYPELDPRDRLATDTRFRSGVLRTASLKAQQGDAVFSYVFAWRSPVLDFGWAGGHTGDVGFVFNNPDLGIQSTGGGPVVASLSEQMSQAWTSFARTGDPNHSGLPDWPAWSPDKPATMVFDVLPDVRLGHDQALVDLAAN